MTRIYDRREERELLKEGETGNRKVQRKRNLDQELMLPPVHLRLKVNPGSMPVKINMLLYDGMWEAGYDSGGEAGQ